MGVVIFNGASCVPYGIQVEHPPGYIFPERKYTPIPIPGRNGELIMDEGTYKNVNRPYQIAFGSRGGNYTALANGVSGWLHSVAGYARLEDSYEPDYFRLATYSESIDIANILQQAGRATITFNCKPERFLKIGEIKTTLYNTQTIVNPTNYTSLPIINVKGVGNGVLNIGNYKVTITNIINSITINSEIEDAYNGGINLNMYITLSNTFPKLIPGNNLISFTGGITSVEIIPRWWTI